MSKDDFELVRGSGNVFRDFGRPNADLEQARAILAARIIGVLDDRKLSARAAEKLTGVAHTDLSRIRNAKLDRFGMELGWQALAAPTTINWKPNDEFEPARKASLASK